MTSAVAVDSGMLSSQFVQTCTNRCIQLIALSSGEPVEDDYLHQVHGVALIAPYGRSPNGANFYLMLKVASD